MARSNGGEGFVGVEPGYFALWPSEDIPVASDQYQINIYCPEFIAVGSNGGGELFVFALSGTPKGLHMVPAIGMDPNDIWLVAPTFSAFEAAFGGDCENP
ncbi:hypothetical protein [Solimonas sp. SE-A11]|uniref:hypothetical protein n=1 Tax=Solimonas sp. SE-A11 TaxID=3054954 RepID=UPI00259C782F|nr:hypothetical protein [Solimonas sp. SE-A11]MDM4769430.1 hypothetical protein [Solimonas sp. SE-A11]